MTSEHTDVLVIGGGIEGLSAATTLARGGLAVRLIAAEETIGEFDAEREFHPGYRAPGLRPVPAPRPWLVDALELRKHGFETRSAPEGSRGVALPYCEPLLETIRELVDAPPLEVIDPRLADLWQLGRTAHRARRRLGKAGFAEALRIFPMSIEDWLAEHGGERPARAQIAAPALFGGWVGPLSPSTAFLWLLARAAGELEPVGGGPRLVAALDAAARAAGAGIELGNPVRSLVVEKGRVRGAETAAGERLATRVLSTAPPCTTLLDWIPPRELPTSLREEIAAVRHRGIVATMQIALGGPVELPEETWVGDDPHDWERAFDAAKHRTIPERPVFRLRAPGQKNVSLAPGEGMVLQLQLLGVPHFAETTENDRARDEIERRTIDRLEELWPGIGEKIVATETLTPADLEQEFGLPGGHLDHGELALDQIFSLRPCGSIGHYRTPLDGLWIAGRGTHPGGPFPGSSGALAARAVLAASRKSRHSRFERARP